MSFVNVAARFVPSHATLDAAARPKGANREPTANRLRIGLTAIALVALYFALAGTGLYLRARLGLPR